MKGAPGRYLRDSGAQPPFPLRDFLDLVKSFPWYFFFFLLLPLVLIPSPLRGLHRAKQIQPEEEEEQPVSTGTGMKGGGGAP